jgi:DNA topoisomerase III
MQLYITEKPSVAKALAYYFNKNGAAFKRAKGSYIDAKQNAVITYAAGHLLFLYTPEQYCPDWKAWRFDTLPLVPPNTSFKKAVYSSKKEQYTIIKELLKEATTVINVGDPDREGQLLIDELLTSITGKIIKRLLLNALDDESIKKALNALDDNQKYAGLSKAGECRSYIDWLIGMNFTRFFTLKARMGGFTNVMRVGRVKAPTLNLIVERYFEIKNFKQRIYYMVHPYINYAGREIPLSYNEQFPTLEAAKEFISSLDGKEAVVQKVEKEIVKETIKELYSLDTLQVDANKYLDFSAKETLDLLQSLYEKKFTSYPRSDCKFLPESQQKDSSGIVEGLNQIYDLNIPLPNMSEMQAPFNDKKITAHHAIIPTGKIPKTEDLSDDEWRLYLLIAKKYASMFFKPFTYQREKIYFSAGESLFTLSIKNIIDAGYKVIYSDAGQQEENGETEITGKFVFIENQSYPIIKTEEIKRETKPPKYYNEGSIIKAMSNISSEDQELSSKLREVKGIGTPATRATIIEELIKENLIQTEKKNLIPTEAGIQLISLLPEEIKKADYTALMELKLDQVQNGDVELDAVIQETLQFIENIIQSNEKVQFEDKSIPCPICKKGFLHLKQYTKDGKKIQYVRCSNELCGKTFPAIKGKAKIILCPTCKKGFMQSRQNRTTGDVFYSCSCYPDCKQTMNEETFQKAKG